MEKYLVILQNNFFKNVFNCVNLYSIPLQYLILIKYIYLKNLFMAMLTKFDFNVFFSTLPPIKYKKLHKTFLEIHYKILVSDFYFNPR